MVVTSKNGLRLPLNWKGDVGDVDGPKHLGRWRHHDVIKQTFGKNNIFVYSFKVRKPISHSNRSLSSG